MTRKPGQCHEPGCRREALPRHAFCDGHLMALLERQFGKSGRYPVKATA